MAKKMNTGNGVEPTSDLILGYLDRWERLETEKSEVTDQLKELKAELTGNGLDGKTFLKLVALRKKKPDDIENEDAMLDLYKRAAGLI